MIKNLLAATLFLWVAVLCIERSMEFKAGDFPGGDSRIKSTLEASIPDLVVALKAAEARKDSKAVENALWQLALTNWQLRRFDRADPFFSQLLSSREKERGSESAQLLPLLQAAGGMHRDWGKFESAGRFYERAQRIDELTHGAESTEASRDLNNRGVVSFISSLAGDPDLTAKSRSIAQAQFEKAAAIQAHGSQVDSTALSILLSNQSVLLSDLGQSGRAENLAAKAKDIRQSAGHGSVR